ncbi:hypothetical protein [Candidatus Liberibacter americanus]|uniref:Uncharacterized protein n=1 Tax=Candidatus Liberibacter americanus str. Sao Paulo TaxID=1261131 RepID=U6B5J5_9HYPH|nr:hypothetical protein [Candidatus Liberibacter americanus]AHA28043.1 hypothetical protein lam_697 [Candidatus Liberibacter americanus str. Sao Paulo]EMS35818.1 hypothetical protein G653_04716 [Candidatus Liberibacter americanus PW_SP]
MTDFTPYISNATPATPSKDHVLQRPSEAEGIRNVSHALANTAKVIDNINKSQASFKAYNDYMQASEQAERTFNEKLLNLRGKDETEVRRNLDDIINKDIKPLYGKLLSNISHPEVGIKIKTEMDNSIKNFKLKANEYEIGLRMQRAKDALTEIRLSASNSIRLNGSDDNFKDKKEILTKSYNEAPLDIKTKENLSQKGITELANAQADWHVYNNPNVYIPFLTSSQKHPEKSVANDPNASIADIIDNTPFEVDKVLNSSGDYIPFEGWRYLSTEKRLSILHTVANSSTQGRQEKKSRLGAQIKNIISFLDRGYLPAQLDDPEMSEDNIKKVYGESDGAGIYSRLRYKVSLVGKFGSLSIAPEGEWQEELKKFEPTPQDLTGAEYRNNEYSKFKHSLVKNAKDRKEDPIKWAKEKGLTGDLPDDPSHWGDFFVSRKELSNTMEKMYRVKSPIISKEEGRKLTAYLDKLESADVTKHLQAYSEYIGGLKNPTWIETMKNLEHPILGEVGLLLSADPLEAQDIIRGYKDKSRNRGENIKDAINEGITPWIERKFRSKYGNSFATLDDGGDAEFARVLKLTEYHMRGQLLRSKEFSFDEAPKKTWGDTFLFREASKFDGNLEHSFKFVVGNLPVKVNESSYLIPPRGMDSTRFTDVFDKKSKEALTNAGHSGDLDVGYENWEETIEGDRKYAVKFGRDYVLDPKTKKPLIITIRDAE